MSNYAFVDGVLRLPNGDTLTQNAVGVTAYKMPYPAYTLKGPKGGIRHAYVELWVHGGPARDEAQFLSFLNGDAHDQSKCQVHGGRKIWSVS